MASTRKNRSGRPNAIDQSRMSFGDHLEELRSRLIRALLGIGVGMGIAMFFASDIISLLCQPLVLALAMEGLNPRLYQEQVPQLFLNYLQTSVMAGLIIASPWVLYQIWKFVSAGLYEHEQKAVRVFGPASLGLFLLGASFVYFIVLPFGLRFFVQFNRIFPAPSLEFRTPLQDWLYGEEPQAEVVPATPPRLPTLAAPPPYAPEMEGSAWIDASTGQLQYYHQGKLRAVAPTSESLVQPWYNLGDYLSFSLTLMIVFGIGFQMPLVILFLSGTGIVPVASMRRARKPMILIVFILAAILTPPDVISQVMLAIPMWGLFELGMVLGRRAELRRARNTDA